MLIGYELTAVEVRILKNTFASGVHPPSEKELSSEIRISDMPAPKTVFIPIRQHIGAKPEIVVAPGQSVLMGQLIAKASSFVSSNIFSSVSGTVKNISMLPLLSGEKAEHIVIENNGRDEFERLPKLLDPSKEQILERIRACGIVGMGGAGFPADVKLSPPAGKGIDTLLINGAECEPYITCDHRIMLEYTELFIKGVQYLLKASGASRAVIGVEKNKQDAIDRINLYLQNNNISDISVTELKVKYPQGAEKQLIFAATKRRVPSGGLPVDVGAVVQNVHTALSVYFAVWDGQPLFRRVMTLSGRGCARPNNVWVRNGTSVQDILEFCGYAVPDEKSAALTERFNELLNEVTEGKKGKRDVSNEAKELSGVRKELESVKRNSVERLINGGPMMGQAISSVAAASGKTMSCLLMLTAAEVDAQPITQCINCGRCGAHCPMSLLPMQIDAYDHVGDFENAKKYGAMDCMQCGCCAYVCPAKRPLVQSIAHAKQVIKERKL